MLPQQDIDSIIHASRACDEGPTQLARRIESAVEAAERERCAGIARKYGRADGGIAQQIAAEILGA